MRGRRRIHGVSSEDFFIRLHTAGLINQIRRELAKKVTNFM